LAEAEDEPANVLGGGRAVLAILALLACMIGGGALGWAKGGPLLGLLGTLLGAALGVLIFGLVRFVDHAQRFGERSVPDLRALPADQALRVLGAIVAGSGSALDGPKSVPGLASGLLAELALVRELAARGDHAQALAKLDALAPSHSRAPALPAERARVLRALGRGDEAIVASSSAIELALHGGMNRLAAQLFAELDLDAEAKLELDAASWAGLARALDVHGDEAAASRCRSR